MTPEPPVGRFRQWWRRSRHGESIPEGESHLECQLGWARLIAGLTILGSAWQNPTEVPTWIMTMLLVAGGSFLASAVVTLVVEPRLANLFRVSAVLSVLDAILLGLIVPFGVVQDSPYLFLVFMVSAMLGGLRLGRVGVLRNLVILAPFETVRLIVGQSLYGGQAVEDTVIAILLAAGVGVLVADVASSGRRARRQAAREEARAADERHQTRRLAWEVDVLADVVTTAGTGPPGQALGEALAGIHEHLHLANAELLTIGPTDDLVVAATTRPGASLGTTVPILPGGPKDRAMSLGTVAAATHDDLDALAAVSGHRPGSVVAAPLPVGGRLLGVLACESPPGDLLHRRDAALIGRLGRVLAPFVDVTSDERAGVVRATDERVDHADDRP